jgi:hypothetical protein
MQVNEQCMEGAHSGQLDFKKVTMEALRSGSAASTATGVLRNAADGV